MLLDNIYEILHKREEFNFESEANRLYYVVTYDENQIKIYEVEEYHYDGDNWGEIETKSHTHLLEEWYVSIEEYLDSVLRYARIMSQGDIGRQIMEYEFPYVGYSVIFKRGDVFSVN